MVTDLNTLSLLAPELILVLLAAWVFVASAFRQSRLIWTSFCGIGLVFLAIALWRQDTTIWQNSGLLTSADSQALMGPLFVDAFGHTGRWLAAALVALFLPLAAYATTEELTGEFLGAMILAFVGLMIVCTAADLVLLLLGLELISIPTYVLLFIGRNDRRGSEATMKYFFLSILSSALFVYGLSFIYGAAGSTHLLEINQTLVSAADPMGIKFVPLAVVLMFVGLGFKIAAVPFHFYAPDVYQATSYTNAGLLAVLPKAAGVFAMVRLGVAVAPAAGDLVWQFAIVISIASMTLGNVCALWQRDLRRMLAYSSIAHAGYMLIGIATGLAGRGTSTAYDGLGAMYFYLMVYCGASVGAFATLAYLGRDDDEIHDIEQLGGLPGRHPIAAAMLAIFMFSLSGIPPLAGFWGKLTLFTSGLPLALVGDAKSIWFTVLLIAAALNAAIAAGYYLRVIAKTYFGTAEDETRAISRNTQPWPALTAGVCGLVVVIVGFMPGTLIRYAHQAGGSVQADAPTAELSIADRSQSSQSR